MKRIIALLAGIIVALSCAGLGLSAPPANAVSETLADLGMAHPRDLRIDRTSDGRKLLRFSSIVVNVGTGKFEVYGQRSGTGASEMPVNQRIYNDTEYVRDHPTSARMYFGGDGHNHWHVRDLEDFELVRLDNGSKLDTQAKHGFCFYDIYRYKTLPGTPANPVYTHCGGTSDLSVTMGLSVGWGDVYDYRLPDQYMDITGMSPGRYRLVATADESNWFLEANESNNQAWVDIQIKRSGVSIVGYGPQA